MKERLDADGQLYIQVIENLEDAVAAIDSQGRIALFNPAAQELFGISERLCLGRLFDELFIRQEQLLHLIRSVVRDGRSISDHQNIVLERLSASPLPASVTVSPLFTRSGKQEGVVLIIRDLSRIRELEEAVRHTDRLSTLGTLAAGLAHEIKNPLGGIKGAAQLLDMEIPAGSPLKEYTVVMIREAERVNGIIEELMDLARQRPPEFSQVNLSKVLGDIVLFQREACRGKAVEFVLHLDPSIPPIHGDENLLTRLFLNLIKNAGEAIEGKGRVEIATRVSSDYHLLSQGGRPVPLIVIEIRDDGKGISAEDLDKIFTPFYTTKDYGSGIGLAICQKIINEHRGFLKVESTPGAGTLFSVQLPFIRG